MTVPAGATNATFTITTSPVTSATAVGIAASLNGIVRSQVLSVFPSPALSALDVTPSSVTGGSPAQGLVTLTGAAPAGGTVVALQSDHPQIAAVPASVTVPAGATSVTFTVTTSAVTSATAVGIVASQGGVTRSAILNVTPAAVADQVSITKAEYRASKHELRVEATSSSSSATLSAYVTATNALIGTLTNQGCGS